MRKSRYRRTLRFFTNVMIGEIWWDFLMPRIGLGGLSRRTRAARMRRIAASFRSLAIRMGGVLIKVGQFLSSRLDVLPREITAELAGLQDEVGAESFEAIRGEVEAEFGMPLAQKFLDFERVPVASASIGQVHRARLVPADPAAAAPPPVVVKVQRPHIQEIVEADLAAIRVAGRWLQRFKTVSRHVNVPALVEEFSRSLYEEIDYLNEGKNAEKFAANFRGRPEVVVPSVVWTHTTRRVLTLQDVGAIKITDYAAIEAAGISRAEVADKLMDVYLKQVFEDGFFHADPHPGNLFVLPVAARRGAWKLVFVDFGMTGTLAADSFDGLREMLLAVGTRDASRLVKAFQRLQVLLPGADLELLERACKRVFDTLWGKSTREMMRMSNDDFRVFAAEFGDLLYEMPFQVPENLILLGRCVSILSGMASGLNPDFSVWSGLAPYVQKLMEKDGQSGVGLIVKEIGAMARVLLGLPKRVDDVAARMEQGRMEVRIPELRQHVARLERGVRKLAGAIIFSAGMVAGTELFLGGHLDLAIGLGAVEVLLLLWILLGR
jgi:predicted unusual protein kinase regulating ubiquinone biosynthesis (AarF/ABC1/UbiB family)